MGRHAPGASAPRKASSATKRRRASAGVRGAAARQHRAGVRALVRADGRCRPGRGGVLADRARRADPASAMAFAQRLAARSAWRAGCGSRSVLGGLCFAADLASWHIGILKTTLANATLFGNSATLFFPVYGFLIARAWPSRTQGFALLLALVGAVLLMGRSYPDRARASRRRLALPARGHPLHRLFRRDGEGARHDGADPRARRLDPGEHAAAAALRAVRCGEQVMPHRLDAADRRWRWRARCSGQGLMIFALGQLSPLVVGIGAAHQPVVAATIGWIGYGERLDGVDLVGAVLVAVALVLVRASAQDPPRLPPTASRRHKTRMTLPADPTIPRNPRRARAAGRRQCRVRRLEGARARPGGRYARASTATSPCSRCPMRRR